jgi:2-hydroxychromene-2-carboxylate isomerase
MAEARPIEFWFTMGSTYSYLAVMRLPAIEKASGIAFRWRPFHLLTLLQEMKHVPFADKPAKLAYMWRDLERRAAMRGIPIRLPAPYPLRDSLMANRVAILGLREGWGTQYVTAAYRRWFQAGQESGSEPNLSESIKEAGADPTRVLALAGGDEIARLIESETQAARERGIFGSPTFVVEDELFWGDDRLEDAVSWHRHGAVRPALAAP